MRPYELLSLRGQVGRLRRLAAEALPKFGLPADTALDLLHHGENTTFRLRDLDGVLRVLRIHRPDYQRDEHIRSELLWLEALRRDTDLLVPLPHRGIDGDTVQHAYVPGVDQARRVTCVEWIDGQFTLKPGSPKTYRAIGAATGALHAHGQTWERPPNFTRRRWDLEALVGEETIFGDPMAVPGLRAKQQQLIGRARDRVRRELADYGTGSDRFGLIHADMHLSNVLRSGDRPAIIDFDDCGFGWYAYELTVSLLSTGNQPSLPRAKAAWVEGYRTVRPFDDEHVERVDLMWLTRNITMLGWLGARLDNPRLRAYLPLRIRIACDASTSYLKTGRVFS